MRIYCHGENAITFALFSAMGNTRLLRLLRFASWHPKANFRNQQVKCLHLFPNFGKRYGYGEPDALVITDKSMVFIELELDDLSRENIDEHFLGQCRFFAKLGLELSGTKRRRLLAPFVGADGRSFRGPQRLRRLFEQVGNQHLIPHILVISAGRHVSPMTLSKRMSVGLIPIGWVGYRQLGRKIGLSNAVRRTIVENLAP